MDRVQELERTVAALATRIADLEAVAEIQRLKARYGELTDQRYTVKGHADQVKIDEVATQIAELFTEDAVWDGGKGLGVARGRQEIYERLRNPTVTFAWHFFVKPQIQVDGDRATGSWDILSPCTRPGDRGYWMAGVEHDEYRRVGGSWLHQSMRLDLVFMSPYDRGWATKRAPEGETK